MAFRAGDEVHHAPSDEDWVLAVDEHRGDVLPCGWPQCIAKASDCTLMKAATDDERIDMLRGVANARGGGWRGAQARHQLNESVIRITKGGS